MKISGSGRLSGGKIDDEIHISGSARIDGNFECNGLRSSGSLRGAGNLIVHGDIKSSGSFRVAGYVQGDGDARSSGSSRVGGGISIKGKLGSSGSISVGKSLEAQQGIIISGSAKIQEELLSQQSIVLEGSLTSNGDISGKDVFMGTHLTRSKKVFKHPFKIYGNIYATNKIDLTGAHVKGDVKGRDVRIGKGTEVLGTVYYVDNLETDKQSTLANEPVQIEEENLKEIIIKK
jgi:cytoskeletal protein CcmA (bactofilin family)